VAAIEGAAGKLSPSDLAAALSGAFDRIERKIASFDTDEAATPTSPAPEAAPPEAMNGAPATGAPQAEAHAAIRVEEPAEATVAMQTSPAAPDAVATSIDTKPEPATDISAAVADPAVAQEPPMTAPSTTAASEDASEPTDAFDANDEAVLDIVAMEMAAPDTDEAYEPKLDDAEVYERQVHESQISESQIGENQVPGNQIRKPQVDEPQPDKTPASAPSWEIDITFASDASDAAEAPEVATALSSVTPLQPEPEPLPAPSLGSSLLANGIVTRPRSSTPDPLAPIRRMSQNEKIAFFS
jgi:hypothetical protein